MIFVVIQKNELWSRALFVEVSGYYESNLTTSRFGKRYAVMRWDIGS